MTLKEIFKKVETYNEVAELMLSQKARVHFWDRDCFSGDHFTDYKSLAKYVRREYFKPAADEILSAADYEIDGEKVVTWVDSFGSRYTFTIVVELTA